LAWIFKPLTGAATEAPTLTFLVSLEELAPVKNPDLHKGVGADTLAACMETDAISNSESSALRKKELFCYTTTRGKKALVRRA
jgi:hypothetical protein